MTEWGALLLGLGTLVSAVAAVLAVVANRKANEAKAVSPQAVLEGLRAQVQAVVTTHQEAVRRYEKEREGMEDALTRERKRADGAEMVGLQLQASLAEMRIDLASARSEVAELKQRFDAAIAGVNGH